MDPVQFLAILDSSLSLTELEALFRWFGYTDREPAGADRRTRAGAFVEAMRRRGRLDGLAEATVALRPDLAEAVALAYAGDDGDLAWLDEAFSGLTAADVNQSQVDRVEVAAMAPDESPVAGPPAADLPANPYVPGRVVTDDDMFFGREVELRQLQTRLSDREHAAIVGPRMFGGSSLLYRLSQSLPTDDAPGILPAYVGLKDEAHQTPAGVLSEAWGQWWERVRPGTHVPVGNMPEFVTGVRKLNSAGFRPVLLLDEFEQLTWRVTVFDDDFLDAWHELGREGSLSFVLTAHSTPADLLAQSAFQSKFYELFKQLDLGLLDPAAAEALLSVPAQRAGLAIPEGAVEHLLNQAGPHPFFLHLAGLYLYDGLVQQSYSRAEVTEQFQAAAEPYWQELWDGLSPLAQAHYPLDLVREPSGMTARQLRILANKGLVIQDEAGFRPFSTGFANWLRRIQAATTAATAASGSPPTEAAFVRP